MIPKPPPLLSGRVKEIVLKDLLIILIQIENSEFWYFDIQRRILVNKDENITSCCCCCCSSQELDFKVKLVWTNWQSDRKAILHIGRVHLNKLFPGSPKWLHCSRSDYITGNLISLSLMKIFKYFLNIPNTKYLNWMYSNWDKIFKVLNALNSADLICVKTHW